MPSGHNCINCKFGRLYCHNTQIQFGSIWYLHQPGSDKVMSTKHEVSQLLTFGLIDQTPGNIWVWWNQVLWPGSCSQWSAEPEAVQPAVLDDHLGLRGRWSCRLPPSSPRFRNLSCRVKVSSKSWKFSIEFKAGTNLLAPRHWWIWGRRVEIEAYPFGCHFPAHPFHMAF